MTHPADDRIRQAIQDAVEQQVAVLRALEGRVQAISADGSGGGDTAAADAHPGERESRVAGLAGLLEALRALDRAVALSDVFDVLVREAAAEAGRAALFLARGDRLEAWRYVGFPGAEVEHLPQTLPAAPDNVVTQAWAAGQPGVTTEGGAVAPRFAVLPAGRAGFALPIQVGGRTVGVLYVDDASERPRVVPNGWPETVEILTRHAARCLESLTALKASKLYEGGGDQASGSGLEREARDTVRADAEESARRYARLLVAEIKLYHPAAVEAGRRERNLGQRLASEIDRARGLYEERVAPDVRAHSTYFCEELVRTLAGGDASLLSR